MKYFTIIIIVLLMVYSAGYALYINSRKYIWISEDKSEMTILIGSGNFRLELGYLFYPANWLWPKIKGYRVKYFDNDDPFYSPYESR